MPHVRVRATPVALLPNRAILAPLSDALPTLAPLRHPDGRSLSSERMLGTMRAIAEAIFATSDGPPSAARIAWLMAELEDFLARAGGRTRWVLRISVLVVSLLAPLEIMRFTSLSRMPLCERTRALRQLEGSRRAAPLLAVKALLSILYYEHPDAARQVGFDAKCLKG